MKIKPIVQFSLRSLLALITIGCVALGRWVESARVQRDAVNAILRAGGDVYYDLDMWDGPDPNQSIVLSDEARHDFSIDLFHTVTRIYASYSRQGDDILGQIKHLPDVSDIDLPSSDVSENGLSELRFWQRPRLLCLPDTAITDHDLPHIKCISNLRILIINDTRITESGAHDIQAALRNCEVIWRPSKNELPAVICE